MKLKYKVITSAILALVVAGCGVNNDNGRKNVGFNTNNTDTRNVRNVKDDPYTPNTPLNVNEVYDRKNNGANTDTNIARNNGINTRNNTNTNQLRNVGNRNFNDNDFRLSQDIANRISGMKEVKSANVLLTDNTAYVAAVLNNDEGGRISTRVENKIADTVRSVDRSIDNVYVSTNPDFVNRVGRYTNDVTNGRPVRGFGKEFGELVNRVFPNAR